MEEETKVCTKCKRLLPLPEFSRNRQSKSGYRSQCKQCHKEVWKKRYYSDSTFREKRLADRRRYSAKLSREHPFKRSLITAKSRCKEKGLPHEISESEEARLREQYDAGVCALSKITFVHYDGVNKQSPYTYSLDHIEPALGNSDGNLRLILFALNCFKGQGTDEDCHSIADAVHRQCMLAERGMECGR